MSAIDYISNNNLPCVLWLDGNINYIDNNSSTFVWQNRYGSSDYNFIQTNPFLHPTVITNGVSFFNNQKLYPLQNTIFDNSLSYTIIIVSRGNLSNTQQLVEVGKVNPALPKFLEIKYETENLNKDFSLLNFTSNINLNNASTYPEVLGISHNIKLGRTKITVNNSQIITKQAHSKGYVLNNISNFYLGNSSTDDYPFIGTLNHFLIFTPEINDIDLLSICSLLSQDSSEEFKLSTEFFNSSTLNISTASSIEFNPLSIYSLPVIAYKTATTTELDLSLETLLLLAYVWDELSTEQWNSLTEDEWANVLRGIYP